jgi:CubicO group peptidase (beta-lactamase class C family)
MPGSFTGNKRMRIMYIAQFPKGNKIKITVLMLMLFSPCAALFSQTIPERLDSFFTGLKKNDDINGSVLVAEKGNVLYLKSFGYADVQNKIANTENTLFQLASVSKTFTSLAVLQLVEKKKLALTDKLIRYFPDFPYPEITIRQLLSHTSGLTDYYELFDPYMSASPDSIFTIHDIIPALKQRKLSLHFQPGEKWEYCNLNFNLLALLVEKISGLSFQKYLRKNVFLPAGMRSTFVKTDTTVLTTIPNVAYNYDYHFLFSPTKVRVDSFATPQFKSEYKTFALVGDGNVYTTTIDLMKFDQALYDGSLLDKRIFLSAITPAKLNNGNNATILNVSQMGKAFYGCGWFIFDDTSMGKIAWHGGGMPGCRTIFMRNVDKHQLVIVLANAITDGLYKNALCAMDILNKRNAIAPLKPIAKYYGKRLIQYGDDDAFTKLIEMLSDTLHYKTDENEFNDLGYAFFNEHDTALSLTTFRTAILLFPSSDNLFNSYGEILAKVDKKEEAIMMYRKSLLLNPKNEDSKKSLENLEKQ